MAEKGSFCRSIIVETASIYFTECCARTFPVGEFADDFAFNLDRIDRANNHQPCAVGHIPFAIQCLHLLCRSVLQNVQLSDRIARGEIAVGIEQFARSAVALETEILPVAHLGDDDAAFAVNRARIERNFACRFAHQEERAFDQGGVCLWKIQLVLRTNKTGGGVCVGPERQAKPLKNADHFALGHIGRSVERHMFDEVGETLFVVGFRSRPEFESQPDQNLIVGALIAADGIAQAIGELPIDDTAISFEIGGLAVPRRGACRSRRWRRVRRDRCGNDQCARKQHQSYGSKGFPHASVYSLVSYQWQLPLVEFICPFADGG